MATFEIHWRETSYTEKIEADIYYPPYDGNIHMEFRGVDAQGWHYLILSVHPDELAYVRPVRDEDVVDNVRSLVFEDDDESTVDVDIETIIEDDDATVVDLVPSVSEKEEGDGSE